MPFRPIEGSQLLFCGKDRDEVAKLVAGPGVFICNECITLAMGQLAKPR